MFGRCHYAMEFGSWHAEANGSLGQVLSCCLLSGGALAKGIERTFCKEALGIIPIDMCCSLFSISSALLLSLCKRSTAYVFQAERPSAILGSAFHSKTSNMTDALPDAATCSAISKLTVQDQQGTEHEFSALLPDGRQTVSSAPCFRAFVELSGRWFDSWSF